MFNFHHTPTGSLNFTMANIPTESLEEAKIEKKEPEVEEWVWVDGYKGTTADMRCRDSQFELGHRYYMPEETEIKLCHSGYHFCLHLKQVFGYYDLENNNRFFKVRALVRKKEYEEAAQITKSPSLYFSAMYSLTGHDGQKLTSKAIEFVSEVDEDEIFKAAGHEDFNEEERKTARMFGVNNVIVEREKAKAKLNLEKLVALGYSEAFAALIMKKDRFEEAFAAGTQEGLSMDMKVLTIFIDNICD